MRKSVEISKRKQRESVCGYEEEELAEMPFYK